VIKPISYIELIDLKPELLNASPCYAVDLNAISETVKYYGIYHEKSGDLKAAFCLQIEKRKGILHVSNPPFFQNCGLTLFLKKTNKAERNSENKRILDQMASYLEEFCWVNISLPNDITDGLPFYWKGFSLNPRYTYLLSLKSETDMKSHWSSGLKSDIKKLERSEIAIKHESDAKALKLLRQHNEQFRGKKDLAFYDQLIAELMSTGSLKVTTAKHEKGMGTVAFLEQGNMATYLLGGSNKIEGVPLGTAALWAAVISSYKRNITLLDFEGSMIKGVERYFSSWGGDITPYLNINKEPKIKKVVDFIKS